MPAALQTPQSPPHVDPSRLIGVWPAESGLVLLWSGRPGRRRVTVARPERWVLPRTLSELEELWAESRREGALLAGFLTYKLGRRLEPASGVPGAAAGDGAGWPLMAFARCREWATWTQGASTWAGPLAARGLLPAPAPTGPGRPGTLAPGATPLRDPDGATFRLGRLRSRTGRARYEQDAAQVIERIREGDVYQVNLAHELAGAFHGSSRALCAQLLCAADPWHGAYLEGPGGADDGTGAGAWALCSLSPELFLEYEPQSRRITTRPMKGTRPGGADPAELARAAKDTAELNMIIDLMRNDLGRSCAFGSVRVEAPRVIERHGAGAGSVLQATGEVSGALTPQVSFLEALGRSFPPGSVTGAPKIQAMRMIEALEPAARGPYCGSVCELRPDGSAVCNVAIRTALIREAAARRDPRAATPGRPGWFDRGELTWSVGAGIVADSDPASEWRETLDKAEVLVAHTESGIDD